jgi:hypothetical protein
MVSKRLGYRSFAMKLQDTILMTILLTVIITAMLC